jgi:hypothetical protein
MTMAATRDNSKDVTGILATNERLVSKLHPHVFSFFRYYSIGIVLLVWTIVMTWLFYWGYLKDFADLDWFGKGMNPLIPALLWFLVALVLGLTVVRSFNKGLQVLYWTAAVLMLVLAVLFIWVWGREDIVLAVTVGYAYLDAILTIIVAEIYRRAFSYYITDMRIVIRYKLFSSNEVNLRFEKIEDWKIARSFIWRILGVGTIRPYTGTEDGKADLNREFDAPDECLYGIKNPEGIKRQLVDLVLERDRIGMPDYEEPAEMEPAVAPEAAPPPTAQEVAPPVAAAVPAPAQEPQLEKVEYYQPSPPPEAPTEPETARNYERVDPSAYAAEKGIAPPEPYEDEDEEEGPPPVRMMYPQAEEPGTETRLQDEKTMAFEQPRPGPKPPKKRKAPEPDDPDTEVYDENRPRSL